MRYAVHCDGQPVGYVDLPAPNDSTATGFLEPLPAFDRVRPILERAQRLGDEASDRLLQAMRDGRITSPPLPPGENTPTGRDFTPEELAIFGDEALEAGAAASALRVTLHDDTGAEVPGTDVTIWPFGWPGDGGANRPEVMVHYMDARQDTGDTG